MRVRTAFKEWATVVDALGRGDQIVILRKGGISEGREGFKVEHSRFLLFPTLFHQQRESVIDPAQNRYDEISANFPKPDRLRIEYYAEVVDWRQLTSLQDAQSLRGQHIWRDEVIAERVAWGRTKDIYVFAVRVFSSPHTHELPMASSYGGCKSWVELEEDISIVGAVPVLNDDLFTRKLVEFRRALEPVAQSTHPP